MQCADRNADALRCSAGSGTTVRSRKALSQAVGGRLCVCWQGGAEVKLAAASACLAKALKPMATTAGKLAAAASATSALYRMAGSFSVRTHSAPLPVRAASATAALSERSVDCLRPTDMAQGARESVVPMSCCS